MTGFPRDGDRPIRILHVLWRLSDTGGIPQVVRHLVRGLDKERFEVHVCTARASFEQDDVGKILDRDRFHELGVKGRPSATERLAAAARLARVVVRVRPDIVHLHSGITWLAVPATLSPFRRPRWIVEIHDSPLSGQSSSANLAVERFVLRRRATGVVVHSRSVGADVVETTGVESERICRIPIGFPALEPHDGQRGRQWRARHGVPPEAALVCSIGRLVTSKNPDLFVDVAESVINGSDDTVFVLAGDGPERRRLEERARRTPLHGRLKIVGSEPDVPGLLAASDVFLSTSRYEGFGMAILEAMAAGIPVVATDVGAVSELVEDGVTGWLAAPDDRQSLAILVSRLLEDPNTRTRLGLAGRRAAADRFSLARMVTGYADLYARRPAASPVDAHH